MLPDPKDQIAPNSWDYETLPLIKATGFREYDARWKFGEELNLYGVQALGLGLGTLIHETGVKPKIITAHDYRSYSLSIKQALTVGLMNAGIEVHDIGLALSPMAYFAQYDLDIPCVAMVTASHNANGWTGVKMGVEKTLTFGPDEMKRLKEIVLENRSQARHGGHYTRELGVAERYIADAAGGDKLSRPIRAVVAAGNGTAGAFAPKALKALGAEVIEMDCTLDHSFPKYNPNPEDMKMLHAMAERVREEKADIGLAFDGDGDRCGVVDNTGEEIFADKMGVILARDLSHEFPEAQFVADVKSTGLFNTDPVMQENKAETDYWKTGHSYIKRRVRELGALAGFEKSGHYFFNAPIGRGYDDGLISAAAILRMLDRNPGKSLADLREALPRVWGSPTMSPHCDDEKKYDVVDRIIEEYRELAENDGEILGRKITDVVTVNGVRVTLSDGTWGLVRASSNTPNLVVVVESPSSKDDMVAMFRDIEARLARHPEIGEFDQKI
ncbi:MAG: phosphomannomutase/phosphoglucomutase [Euryhalocaulis sp.]|uniref:phosphomannomutase/phosphoglucomutase n=1 Tax=Euryhalocaulis sp. TaxID=2744307 RepID=UPI0018206395|nr:phosphomannomutase/phosphoglucomutase [Euryhalocaulis sp.]MBA4802315.1 phosphomannomutase/phosphoglucomutase [Euryhalocaulis sp.]